MYRHPKFKKLGKKMSNKKMYTCPFAGCTSAFNRPYRLAQHRLVHINIKPYGCSEENCTKEYTSKSHLDRHVNSVHRQTDLEILYCCPICMKNYVNRQNLKRHMKKSHGNTKDTFICHYCTAIFKQKHQIKAHMFLHTGVKSFRCTLCSKDFASLTDKKKHMRNHKVYQCEHCDSKFNLWSDLMSHKRNDHNSAEWRCNECDKIFKDRTHILRHLKKHMPNTEATTYFCPYDECGRHYSRNSNLKQHILVKHEGRRFDCELCGASLSTKAKLNEHIDRHARPKVILRVPKTLLNGRRRRKDYNNVRVSSAMKLAGIVCKQEDLPKHEPSSDDDQSYENNNMYYDYKPAI